MCRMTDSADRKVRMRCCLHQAHGGEHLFVEPAAPTPLLGECQANIQDTTMPGEPLGDEDLVTVARRLFNQRVQEFVNAAAALSAAYEDLKDQDFTTAKYPFTESFGEVLFRIMEWQESMKKEPSCREVVHLGNENGDPVCGEAAGTEWVTSSDRAEANCPLCLAKEVC